MTPPRLNRALVLEAQEITPDGMGGGTKSWIPQGRLWAQIITGTGRQEAGEFTQRDLVGYRITVRAAPDGAPSRPCAGQRFRAGARIFDTLAVAERDADARYLVCFAQERGVR